MKKGKEETKIMKNQRKKMSVRIRTSWCYGRHDDSYRFPRFSIPLSFSSLLLCSSISLFLCLISLFFFHILILFFYF